MSDPTLSPGVLEALLQILSANPWLGYVVATLTAIGGVASLLISGASLCSRILERRTDAGEYLFDYPRLRAVVHEIALTPKPLLRPPGS